LSILIAYGFELPVGATYNSHAERSTEEAYSGSWSGRILISKGLGDDGEGIITLDSETVVEDYLLEMDFATFYAEYPPGADLIIEARWDATGFWIEVGRVVPVIPVPPPPTLFEPPPNKWFIVAVDPITVPSGTTSVELRFRGLEPGASVTGTKWYMDDILVVMRPQLLDQVGICNHALSLLGISRRIASISEDSREAESLNEIWDHALDVCLAELDWSFAEKRAVLVESSTAPPDAWAYAYVYPSDCVKARYIDDDAQTRRKEDEIPFKLGLLNGERVIYTDHIDAELVYTERVTDLAIWPAYFSEFLAKYLSAEIAAEMTNNERITLRAEQRKAMALASASADNFNEQDEPEEPESSFENSRL
jgi:hypothetical protein